jgi:DNA-binding transcriptional LysR family regulator
MDQLKRMAVFAEVVAAGSLTAAARRLGMTPSAVSQHLRQLEGALGLALLHRSTRKLTLTEAGARYIEGCTAMVAAARAAEQALERHRDEPEGELRIAAPIGFGGLLARALAPLRRHPRLTLQLLLDDALVDLIEARVDIALRAGSLPDSSLVARRLGSMGAQMCAAPELPGRAGLAAACRKTWRSTTGWAPGPSAPQTQTPGAAQRRRRDGHGAGDQPCPGQPGHGPACAVRRGLGHQRGRQRRRPPRLGRRAPGAGAAGLAACPTCRSMPSPPGAASSRPRCAMPWRCWRRTSIPCRVLRPGDP